MSTLDILLLFVGVIFVALGFYFRFLRSAAMLLSAYIATLSSLLLYREAAYRLQAIGGVSSLFDGIVFLGLFFLVFIVFMIVTGVAYPDMTLPKLGFLDHLLGGVGGVVVGIIVMVVSYAALSLIVSEQWEPYASFANFYMQHARMQLGPFLRTIRSLYAYLFYFFFFKTGFPPAFVV